MLPDKAYILRFRLWDGSIDEQGHTIASDAWWAFRLFAEPGSADIYSAVELVYHDWVKDTESIIASLHFSKENENT